MMLKNKKIVTIIISIILLLLLLVGGTYAFYTYETDTKVEHITGQIYMNYEETSTISLQDAIPETKEQALARTDGNGVFEFTITGRNTSKNPVYYAIDLLEGNVSTTKTTRILPEHIMIYLERDGEVLIDGKAYDNWNNKRVYVETIPANTKDNITHNYTLRMWFSEDITVSDTDPDADYTTEEWNNGFASLKVRVVGDFEEKSTLPFLVKTIETNIPDNIQEADDDGNRYLTGANPDNYVWYSGKLWRIVGINADGTIKMITQNTMTIISWDINESNNYSTSHVRAWLNNEFLPTLENADTLIADSDWDCTAWQKEDIIYVVKTEPEVILENEKIGLLTLGDYLKVGSESSFLNIGYGWYTMSPSKGTYSFENGVITIQYTGSYSLGSSSTLKNADGIRPVINLVANVKISGGTGMSHDPYIVNGDKEVGKSSELLNNRISGEYIKFNDTLYRIVGVENVNNQKLTKITMMDYSVNNNTIASDIQFGATSDSTGATFTPSSGIGLYLKNWYAGSNVSEASRAMIATAEEDGVVWYQGPDAGGEYDYSLSKTGTPISATIGLPYYGEIFTSQLGGGCEYSNKIWVMTKYSDSLTRFFTEWGSSGSADPTLKYSIRPSFYLKSDIKIESGTGMPHDPYLIVGENKSLSDKIEENQTIISPDNDCTKYVYGGDVDDNYVWYSGKLWRVVAINCDGTIKLVTQNAMTSVAFNTSDTNVSYENSQMHNWLKNEFLPTLANTDTLLADSTWDYTTYPEVTATKVEPVNFVENEKVGLLTIYDHEMTGGASGFLNNGYWWWTMTPKSSEGFWGINIFGNAYVQAPTQVVGVRPSVNLKANVEFRSGDGTKGNPYTIQGDKATGSSSELVSSRVSGEYIKFNDVLYRIVGTETINSQKLTKITMADYSLNNNSLSATNVHYSDFYDTNVIYNTTSGIGNYLAEWYNADDTSTTYATTYIKDNYKAMIATSSDGVIWYQGPSSGVNYDYTLSKTGISISTPIGLPYYGEMFSSQFGNDYTASNGAWTMTINSDAHMWLINEASGGADFDLSAGGSVGTYGPRPSFYLKSDVKITSGSGMPHDPYVITQ